MDRRTTRTPLAVRFWAKVARGAPDECWEWTAYRGWAGYGRIGVDGKRVETASRVAWQLSHGPIPDGMHVLHRCDNPACCNPAHLFLGTAADNVADMHEKGRAVHPRGEKHYYARLSDEAVREIRETYAAGGVSQRELGARYGVSNVAISRVIRRVRWAHV